MRQWAWSAIAFGLVFGNFVSAFQAEKPRANKKTGKPAKAVKAIAKPTDAERADLLQIASRIRKTLAAIPGSDDLGFPDQLLQADVEIFAKAIEWMLRHDEFWEGNSLAMVRQVAKQGEERARELAAGRHPWTDASGRIVHAYPSPIDGSIQPYMVVVPKNYDRQIRPFKRLDVVLHGRNANLNEVSFIAKNDGKPGPAELDHLELHVYGRGNNAYRWAGEQDVHDALTIVAEQYGIDRRFVVLRGFSMGGAGAWHLGLHHPTKWVSVEAGAGFTDTSSKIKAGPLPEYQLRALHIYDAVDYSRNAINVPIVGYGGEIDPQLLASKLVRDRLVEQERISFRKDGLVERAVDRPILLVVGAGMGHKVDDVSAKLMADFHREAVERRQKDLTERRISNETELPAWSTGAIEFDATTYTSKFNDVAAGIRVHRLLRQYEPAKISGSIRGKKLSVFVANVREFEVLRAGVSEFEILEVQAQRSRSSMGFLSPDMTTTPIRSLWFTLDDKGAWHQKSTGPTQLPGEPLAKRHNSQGPIDDAFTRPFLCVRGTGKPWNPKVHDWAMKRLERFAAEWDKNFRGAIRIKADTEYKPRDAKIYNLILFGDPGSNRVIADLIGRLPIRWSQQQLTLTGNYAAADHAPTLIYPNPDNPVNYVVINSGHTFGQSDFQQTNAMLFPRLGDYAVLKVGGKADEVRSAGFFDEDWKLP